MSGYSWYVLMFGYCHLYIYISIYIFRCIYDLATGQSFLWKLPFSNEVDLSRKLSCVWMNFFASGTLCAGIVFLDMQKVVGVGW